MTIGDFIRRLTPPIGYIQDEMCAGPGVPDDWGSGAWQAPDEGRGYFLRAWNDNTGQVATIQSETSFEEASDRLREKIRNGGDWTASVQ